MSKKLQLFLFCTIFMCGSLLAESLTLTNNSSYKLVAVIFNGVGDKLASIRLQPGQTYIWYSDLSPFIKQYDQPYTPYTVRWLCADTRPFDYTPPPKNKKQNQKKDQYTTDFASWEQIPPGATITALGCPSGNKTCVVKKKPEKSKTTKKVSPLRRPYSNQGFNNFSNDGGQTWTNDGGDPWDEDFGEGHFAEVD